MLCFYLDFFFRMEFIFLAEESTLLKNSERKFNSE